MTDSTFEDIETGDSDGTAAAPSVRIPITIKHEIAPPAAVDDLTSADASGQQGDELQYLGDLPDIYIVRIPDDEDGVPDTFDFKSIGDSGQAQANSGYELEVMITTSDLAEIELNRNDDYVEADEPIPPADGSADTTHTFYAGYVAVHED